MPELPYNLQHINKRLKTLIMKHIFGKLQNVIIFPIREGSSIKVMSVIKEYQNSTHIVHSRLLLHFARPFDIALDNLPLF